MSKHNNPTGPPQDQQKEELLDLLFRQASTRQKAPAEDESSIRAAARNEWQKVVQKRKRKNNLFAFGIAASLLLALLVVSNLPIERQADVEIQQVAAVEKRAGDIFIQNNDTGKPLTGRLLVDGLTSGQRLTTNADARLAIRWHSGESIRIDENSELELLSNSQVELISGRIYIDTHNVTDSKNTFVIKTRVGTIAHLGTQYMAGVSAQGISVTVREGKVQVQSKNRESTATQGENLKINESGGVEITNAPTFGTMWEWAAELAPAFNLDGVTAFDFIAWAGRETGRAVVFESGSTEVLAKETHLRGSINLEPGRALELILQTSDLQATIEAGNILIRSRTGT